MGQRYPSPITAAMLAVSNANAGKPRYDSMTDWAGGTVGEDPGLASTNTLTRSQASVALANRDGDVAEADYTPRTLAQKAATLGVGVANDVGRNRGSIAPGQRYPQVGDAAVAAPVVSSISPTTGAQATLPLSVTITGTGFTPFSTVYTGGMGLPDGSAKYISPTQMKVAIWAAAPGTVSVAVMDHGVLSNTDKLFTVT